MTDEKDTMGIKEAAAYLGVSAHTVRRAILEGRLKAAKPRGTYRIRKADLDALFRRQQPPQEPPID